jgi:hypothetical protein
VSDIDVPAAHRRFAAECFNEVWDLVDQEERSDQEIAEMIHMAHASLWHWRQTGRATAKNFAVGTWQLSRVYAVAGNPDQARRYGQESLQLCRDHHLDPFYVAYAHEALARAAAVAGDETERDLQLASAEQVAGRIDSESNREALLRDLSAI